MNGKMERKKMERVARHREGSNQDVVTTWTKIHDKTREKHVLKKRGTLNFGYGNFTLKIQPFTSGGEAPLYRHGQAPLSNYKNIFLEIKATYRTTPIGLESK